MKTLLLLLTCLLAAATATAGLHIAFDQPVDCAAYVASGGNATTIDLLSRNYETGEIRYRLLDANGVALGNGAVFGLTVAADADDTAVRAAILAAIPPAS